MSESPWGSRSFRLFWAAQSVSQVGSAVSGVALPLLAVLRLHASAAEVGLLSGSELVGTLLIGLQAGVWIDRRAPRPFMVAADLVRFALLLSVPVAAGLDVLTLAQLVVVALGVGFGSVFFDTAYQPFLPLLVPDEVLPRATSAIQGSESVAQVVGPGLGGLLVQAFGAVSAVAVDAVSYLFSFACLVSVRGGERRPEVTSTGEGLGAEVREGLSFVRGNRILLATTASVVVLNAATAGKSAVEVVFLVRTLHVSAGYVGLLLSGSGVGGVVGAAIGTRLSERFGDARLLVTMIVVEPLAALLAAASAPGLGAVTFAVSGLLVGVAVIQFNLVGRVWRQRIVPAGMLGRVTASMRFFTYGVVPPSAVGAGLLAGAAGPRTALVVIGLVGLGAPLALLPTGVFGLRDLPR